MDWIFENLGKIVTAVITIIYILASLKGKEEEETPHDPEAQARARRIQEEIRRKILERQRGGQPAQREESPEPEYEEEGPPPRRYVEERPTELYRQQEPEHRYEPPPLSSEEPHLGRPPWARSEEPPPPPPIPAPVARRVQPVYDEESDYDPYAEDPYERQMREIEAQQRKTDALKEKAKIAKRAAEKALYAHAYRDRASLSTADMRNRLIHDLREPDSIRTAILLKEVLDKPVGLR